MNRRKGADFLVGQSTCDSPRRRRRWCEAAGCWNGFPREYIKAPVLLLMALILFLSLLQIWRRSLSVFVCLCLFVRSFVLTKGCFNLRFQRLLGGQLCLQKFHLLSVMACDEYGCENRVPGRWSKAGRGWRTSKPRKGYGGRATHAKDSYRVSCKTVGIIIAAAD